MLQILRNKSQSIFIQIIVVIIALVFVFWGVGANIFNKNDSAIIVNGDEVSFQDFQTAYDNAYNNIRNQFGGNIPQGLLESLGIKEQVINQLIQEMLLRQGAKEMGIHVSDDEIRRTIQEMAQFQVDGTFNRERYDAVLTANHYSPNKFEDSMRQDMLAQKASMLISGFAGSATDQEIEELYRLDKSMVSFDYVEVTPDQFKDTITIDDAAMAEWYKTVSDNYKTEPEVKLQYLDFNYSTIGKKIPVDDATIESYYKEHLDQFTTPEQRHVRHILFRTDENSSAEVREQQEKKAQEILELARSGNDFAELAKQYSEGPSKSQGGDLGFFGRGQMVQSFDDAVFSLKPGEISDVVQTDYGYHIIKLEEVQPEKVEPLTAVREKILDTLRTEQAKPMAFQLANEAYEGIIGIGSLTSYLEKNPDAPLKQTDFFKASEPPADITDDKKLISAAFTLKDKELSSLIETGNGYAILYAEAVKAPAIPELAAIKDRVRADYLEHMADAKAKETAEKLLSEARDSSSLSKAAETNGLTVTSSGDLPRGGKDSKIPSAIVQEAFTLSPSQPYPDEPLATGSSYYAIQFKELKAPETALSDTDKGRYKRAIIQRKQQEILSAWLQNKQADSDIRTHQNL